MSQVNGTPPRFKVGDTVRIDDRGSVGHCRTPRFVRGKTGVIADILGTYRDPEKLAYFRPGFPGLTLYTVRIKQKDLWPRYDGPDTDTLEIDIYQPWLEPA